jgi:hypothetical protein
VGRRTSSVGTGSKAQEPVSSSEPIDAFNHPQVIRSRPKPWAPSDGTNAVPQNFSTTLNTYTLSLP